MRGVWSAVIAPGGWALAACALACNSPPERGAEEPASHQPQSTASDSATPMPSASASASAAAPARPLTLITGGDVSFGRLRGQRLLREPERDDFAPLRRLLDPADVRFVNLESTISDQGGETQSPINQLVFTSPPPAAAALDRAGIDIVSLANNHAWDYGEAALRETFRRLDEVGVVYVGAGTSRAAAYAPKVIDKDGWKIAFVAVTDVWNQDFDPHPGREFVAAADREPLVQAIQKARAIDGVHAVVVSYHGGYEYVDQPHDATRELLRAAIDAGADAVIGHHPHVIQRVAFHAGKPIVYSVGNLLMRMVTGKPWTEFGMLARLRFTAGKEGERPTIGLWICPFHVFGFEPIPFAEDPQREMYERHFRFTMDRLQRQGEIVDAGSAARMGEYAEDGCAPVTPMR